MPMSHRREGSQHAARSDDQSESGLAGVMHRNIHTILEVQQKQDSLRSSQERAADRITRFIGTMSFVYIHIVLFGGWLILNGLQIGGLPQWDPYPFSMLAVLATIEAIFLSTFVLISQNRQSAMAVKRSHLDLQVSLLSEHEVTQLIGMVEAIASHLNVEEAQMPEVKELKRDVRPEVVLETIDQIESDKNQQAG